MELKPQFLLQIEYYVLKANGFLNGTENYFLVMDSPFDNDIVDEECAPLELRKKLKRHL